MEERNMDAMKDYKVVLEIAMGAYEIDDLFLEQLLAVDERISVLVEKATIEILELFAERKRRDVHGKV